MNHSRQTSSHVVNHLGSGNAYGQTRDQSACDRSHHNNCNGFQTPSKFRRAVNRVSGNQVPDHSFVRGSNCMSQEAPRVANKIFSNMEESRNGRMRNRDDRFGFIWESENNDTSIATRPFNHWNLIAILFELELEFITEIKLKYPNAANDENVGKLLFDDFVKEMKLENKTNVFKNSRRVSKYLIEFAKILKQQRQLRAKWNAI